MAGTPRLEAAETARLEDRRPRLGNEPLEDEARLLRVHVVTEHLASDFFRKHRGHAVAEILLGERTDCWREDVDHGLALGRYRAGDEDQSLEPLWDSLCHPRQNHSGQGMPHQDDAFGWDLRNRIDDGFHPVVDDDRLELGRSGSSAREIERDRGAREMRDHPLPTPRTVRAAVYQHRDHAGKRTRSPGTVLKRSDRRRIGAAQFGA